MHANMRIHTSTSLCPQMITPIFTYGLRKASPPLEIDQ